MREACCIVVIKAGEGVHLQSCELERGYHRFESGRFGKWGGRIQVETGEKHEVPPWGGEP